MRRSWVAVWVVSCVVAAGCDNKDGADKGETEADPKAAVEPAATDAKPAAKAKPKPPPPTDRKALAALIKWPPESIEAPPLKATCKTMCGATDKGTWSDSCQCKGKEKEIASPLVARPTEKFNDFFKAYEFEVMNRSDRPTHWASYRVYYYDRDGKQLVATVEDEDGGKPRIYHASTGNGSTFTIAAGETRNLTIGFRKEIEPKSIARIDILFDAWCYGERAKKGNKIKKELCIRVGGAPDERPMPPL